MEHGKHGDAKLVGGTRTTAGMHLLLNGEFVSPSGAVSFYHLRCTHAATANLHMINRRPLLSSLSASPALSPHPSSVVCMYSITISLKGVLVPVRTCTGKRAVPPVCRRVNLQLAGSARGKLAGGICRGKRGIT